MKTELESTGMTVFERGWLSSNNILFGGGGNGVEAVLVDTGYGSHAAQTVALVEAALGGRRLDRIVNTHLHSDHCGGNHALQQRHACAVDVPSGDARTVDDWNEDELTFRATNQQCARFDRTGVVSPGSRIPLGIKTWEVIGSSGHDPHSVALYEPDSQVLIAADALWENGFGVIFPELDGENAFDEVRHTLDLFSDLSIRFVIPGHGAPFQDANAALERAYRRLDRFMAAPDLHARYAAKVLIKFHLLEVRQMTLSALRVWMNMTPYIDSIHRRYFAESPFDAWSDDLIHDLCNSRALVMTGESVHEPSPALR